MTDQTIREYTHYDIKNQKIAEPITNQSLVPVSSNPGSTNTLWINSSNGHLFLGASDLNTAATNLVTTITGNIVNITDAVSLVNNHPITFTQIGKIVSVFIPHFNIPNIGSASILLIDLGILPSNFTPFGDFTDSPQSNEQGLSQENILINGGVGQLSSQIRLTAPGANTEIFITNPAGVAFKFPAAALLSVPGHQGWYKAV